MNKLPKLYFMFKQTGNVHKIYLYDDVTDIGNFNFETWTRDESETSAKHFRDMLAEIPETDEIELYINSNGGSVKEGTAIYNQLKRHGAHKTGYVDGVAHSIAFVILQACDHRIMGEGTSALIHDMWVCTCGNADQLRQEADQLDILMQSSRALFMQRAKNITEEELKELMKKETMLTPDMALEYGFVDEISGRKNPEDDPDDLKNPEDPERDIKDPGADPEDDPEKKDAKEAVEVIQKMRKKFQSTDFKNTLKEFEELVEEEKTGSKKQSVSMMDAFFNIFS